MKKPLIINVRGNSGSGKTMLTRQFMKRLKVDTPIWLGNADKKKQPHAMVDELCGTLAVVGSYNNVCGGCDTITTQAEIINRVNGLAALGFNVIWLEGLLISGMYGSLGEYSEQFGDRWVFAFLDTPLGQCLQHVQKRRKAAGNKKPFNPTNTINRHDTIIRTRVRLMMMERRVVDLPWRDALTPLLKIIRKEG